LLRIADLHLANKGEIKQSPAYSKEKTVVHNKTKTFMLKCRKQFKTQSNNT